MSILTYPLGFIGGGKEDFYNGVIENSLKSGATTATDYLDRDKLPGLYLSQIKFWLQACGLGFIQIRRSIQ